MKKLLLCLALSASLLPLKAQDNRDVIIQAFYWNTFPGDFTNTTTGGTWWDTLATKAPELAAKGFKTIYGPPPTKAVEGVKDCGFAMTDYYDFGNFSSTHAPVFGAPATTTRTRYGNKAQMQSAITAIHNSGMKFMMDIILNHRGGGTAGTYECNPWGNNADSRWIALHQNGKNNFNFTGTPSGRIAINNPQSFHPNNQACNIDEPLHTPYWAPDISQMTYTNNTLISGAPSNGWYYGNSNLSSMADSLVIWGRYLHQNLGIDEFRMDAAKHMEVDFTAAWAVEINNGTQPYIVMENADSNTNIRNYINAAKTVNTTNGKSKNADMASFDFGLKGDLEAMAEGNGSFDMANMNRSYLRTLYSSGVAKENIATFVQNHDHDRGGWRTCGAPEGSQCPTRQVTHNGQCLEYYCSGVEYSPSHNAVDGNKHLPYAYMLASPGRPTIFWKDYYWYGFNDDMDWLMAIRRTMIRTTDEACSMNELNPGGGTYDTHSLNMVYRGTNCTTSATANPAGILLLNDHGGTQEQSTYVDTYFANKELKDYSDQYPFETSPTFDDGGKWRSLLKAKASNYSFWAPTGRYPTSPGTLASKFIMTAAEGGKVHHIILKAADAANFLVGGAPIQVGDEVAVVGKGGTGIAGIGRIGQTFKWNGTHDMIIEVLGSASGTVGGRLAANDNLVFQVKRNNLTYNSIISLNWASSGTSITPNLLRPSTRAATSTTTNQKNGDGVTAMAAGQWLDGGKSILLGFSTSGAPLAINVSNFAAQQQGNNAAQLTWNLENQTGVFVEHKVGDQNFTEIAFLEKGETTFNAENLKAGKHTFRLKTVSESGTDYSEEKTLTIEIPTEFEISKVYPNPFTQSGQVEFTVATTQKIKITVVDALGREVLILFNENVTGQQNTTVGIDATNLSNGIYFLNFEGETFNKSQSFTVLK